MPSLPEFLRWELTPGTDATVVLRSGQQIAGPVAEVDLIDHVLRIDGWTIRIEEIAGVRTGTDGLPDRSRAA